MDEGTKERFAEWRKRRENDPTRILEDPQVRNDALIREIRKMIMNGQGSRLLNGRGT
jgi:hypothetical protein